MVGKLAKKTYKKHENDAQSVQMWVIKNKYKVFFYRKSGLQVDGGLQGSNMSFTIGIQTKWQREMMLRCGHESGVSIDATFGTNKNKVCNYGGVLNVNNLCVDFVITNHLK
jgi:hypothetical protein